MNRDRTVATGAHVYPTFGSGSCRGGGRSVPGWSRHRWRLAALLALTVLLVGLQAGWQAARAADAGMITALSGEATFAAGGATQKAVPFLKFAAGDRLTLSAGASARLVFFEGGRQEVWKGAGQVELGATAGKGPGAPEVSQLPPLVINQLLKTPAAGQQGRTGMVRVRSLLNPDAPAELERQYGELKKGAAAGDTTPEVFLLTGLIDFRELTRAREVLARLAKDPAYQAVVDHFTPLVTPAR